MPRSLEPVSRRGLLRLAVGAGAAALAGLSPRGAGAARGWCRVDPIIRLGAENVGPEIHVWAAVRWFSKKDARRLSNGAIKVIVSVPANLAKTSKRIDRHRGFGDGFDVDIRPDLAPWSGATDIPVQVRVMVPFDRRAAAMTWITADPPTGRGQLRLGRTVGRVNRWMTITATVPPLVDVNVAPKLLSPE